MKKRECVFCKLSPAKAKEILKSGGNNGTIASNLWFLCEDCHNFLNPPNVSKHTRTCQQCKVVALPVTRYRVCETCLPELESEHEDATYA